MAKVLTIGNALVDVVVELKDDSLLAELNLPKGSMQLVDAPTMERVVSKVQGLDQVVASGGSAANTANGLANLGAEVKYIGMVGVDQMGHLFREDLERNSISHKLLIGKAPTGVAMVLVSPDSERTFAVNLGAAVELTPDDITEEMFTGYDFLHIEGYLVQNHILLERCLELAKGSGLRVSLDMASYNVVEENLTFLRRVVEQYVDIVFANEEEAKAFTGQQPVAALEKLSRVVPLSIVKIGAEGSLVRRENQTVSVGVIPAKALDTTGAGDMYAAGFLYGLAHNLPLSICGELGALVSGRVIEVSGPKMSQEAWDEIRGISKGVIQGTVRLTS